jgi:hypothetical protein
MDIIEGGFGLTSLPNLIEYLGEKMKQIKTYFLAALLPSLLCAGLIIGTNAYAAAIDPCAEDISKFCQNIKPGLDTIQCLELHESELTEACRISEAKTHGRRGEMLERVQKEKMFRQACGQEIVLFCKNAGPADGGIMGCLNKHEKELSIPCAKSLKSMNTGKE